MSLRELYQEMILDHGKSPRNYGKLAVANHSHQGHNPVCGDRLIIYVHENEGRVCAVGFEGSGCAISMASASLMSEAVKGKTVTEFEKLFHLFHELVTEGKEIAQHDMGKLAVFSGVVEFPVRVKCATLAWHTLKAALTDHHTHSVSTE